MEYILYFFIFKYGIYGLMAVELRPKRVAAE